MDIIESLKVLADECTDAAEAQDVRDAMRAIILRRVAIEQERERAEKHAEILPRCAAARDKVEALNEEVAGLNRMVAPIAGDIHRARDLLAQHLNRKPDPNGYPTTAELRAYESETARLLREVEKAQEVSRSHAAHLDEVRNAGFRALGEFHQLVAAERLLRPPEAQPATAR